MGGRRIMANHASRVIVGVVRILHAGPDASYPSCPLSQLACAILSYSYDCTTDLDTLIPQYVIFVTDKINEDM